MSFPIRTWYGSSIGEYRSSCSRAGILCTDYGFVTDSSGEALSNASALIVSQDTGTTCQAKSNQAGEFIAPALEPGHYRITIESSGFDPFVTEGVTLAIGEKKSLSFSLTVGGTKQTVTVSGDSELINTTSGDVSEVISQKAITELPLNGRDPSSLIFLSAGITNVLHSPIGLAPGGTAIPTEINASAGGGRQGSTFFLLDGSPNMDTYLPETAPFPNADATEQFRVSTNFDAQYGYAPGAVVSIKTRSGSNEFHGGVFEFLRNNDLNAADYFAKTVDTLKRNQFGGYAGGSIVKDKLFLFANYQGTRQHYAAQYNQASTPTQAMLNGDFSAVGAALPAGGYVEHNSIYKPAKSIYYSEWKTGPDQSCVLFSGGGKDCNDSVASRPDPCYWTGELRQSRADTEL